MLKTHTLDTEIQAVRVEGELYDLCAYLESEGIAGQAHPMWKMPGGFQEDKDPNAIMFFDADIGWAEADIGDYVVSTPLGPKHVPGHIFKLFLAEQTGES